MSTHQRAADRVGAPAFVSPRSSRGKAIAAATGDPQVVEVATAPTADVAHNPDNPRASMGDVSELAQSLTEIGQIVAITVATVDAYLASRPDRKGDLPKGTKWVVVDGNRRLAAAREAGLTSIKIMPGDEFAATDESLLESAYLANAKREDLSDLEEAQALRRLVKFYGSQHKAAKRLGMGQPLISQKISLLELTPELQADLAAGRRNVSHVRNLASLTPEEQKEKADRRARADADKKRKRTTTRAASAGDHSVITPTVKPDRTAPPPPAAPVEVPLPWRDPASLNRVLREHMAAEDRLTLAKLLAE